MSGPPIIKFTLSSIAGSVTLHRAPQYTWTTSYALLGLGLFVLQVTAWSIWTLVLWPRYFSPLRHLPQAPNENLLWGQFLYITNSESGVPHRDWEANIPNDGLIRYTGLFRHERLLVTSPKGLSEVLSHKSYEFGKPQALIGGIKRLLGVGILLAEGEEHKIQRRNLQPAFAFRHIKDLYPVFWSKTQEFIDALTQTVTEEARSENGSPPSAVVEMPDWCSRVTLDIIGLAGFGKDFGAIKDPNAELAATYRKVFRLGGGEKIWRLMFLLIPFWLLSRLPMRRNRDINQAAEVIKRIGRDLIQERKAKLEKGQEIGHDILSVALQSGGFSDANLVDQLMTFLAAGHETTSTSLTWAVYLLCKYPDCQRRLREEIRGKLQSIDDPTPMTAAEIDQLPYLHAVCNEVLRFFPPVPVVFRDAISSNSTILGTPVPRGTRIVLAPAAINRSTALWGDDAGEFNPDRWMGPGLANTGGAESNYAFLTFLHGPRGCIGSSFSRSEFACILAGIVGRFEMELADKDHKLKVTSSLTSKPEGGLQVRMTVLDGW
ncbi:MAG: hypothetical protein M1838_000686 [Thelocarpon superellum]|nr:MAG: hypothetical protein M1838_000686 [Thelocarpon superellum]